MKIVRIIINKMMMRRKRNRKYKSVITQRIFRSVKNLAMIFCCLFLILGMGKVQNTNSFFADSAVSTGNTFSAGYWIVPEIEVTSPESGDEWQVGSTHNIAWTIDISDPLATIEDLDLEYSCDNGLIYNNIDSFSNNPGSYSWTVPENISDQCKIRVTATDSHGLIGSGESDQFEISWMIVLNEFVPDPIGNDAWSMPGGEWVELYNNGDLDINVSGWYLYDNSNSHELLISNGNGNNDGNPFDSGETIVPSGGHLVVFRDGDGDFVLDNNGADSLRLYDGEIGSGANLIDQYDYTITSDSDVFDALNTRGNENMLMPGGIWDETWPGKSFARYPDGTGAWYDPVPTPGDDNSTSLEVDDFKDFFEEWCLDDNGDVIEDNPSCDINLLTALGLLEETEEAPLTEIPVVDSILTPDPQIDAKPTPEPTENPDAITTPMEIPESTPEPTEILEPNPVSTPAPISEPTETPTPTPTPKPTPVITPEPTPDPTPEPKKEPDPTSEPKDETVPAEVSPQQ